LAAAGQELILAAASEEAVVADAREASGQNVQQETADELVGRQCSDLAEIAGGAIGQGAGEKVSGPFLPMYYPKRCHYAFFFFPRPAHDLQGPHRPRRSIRSILGKDAKMLASVPAPHLYYPSCNRVAD
jgi:hypothetical protein